MVQMSRILFAVLLCCAVLTTACQKRPAAVSAVSPVPYDIKVGVVPFTQPMSVGQLITGFIPERQGKIPSDSLAKLDNLLRSDLLDTKRLYTWIPALEKARADGYHDSASPAGLGRWVALGRQYKIDLLLVPQVLDWHQRQGSAAGVTESAHVRLEFFLLDVSKGRVLRRSVFEEKQLGLVEDMTRMSDFIKRRGAWVQAEDLAQEGILKAIKELGL